MNRLKTTLNARLGLMVLMIMGLFLLQMTACVHEPGEIEPMPRDSMPIDTTVIVDTTTNGLQLCDPDTVYFQFDVLPILLANCAISGCHDAASHAADVILDNHDNTIKTTEIKLTDPATSDIYERITDIDPNIKMPVPPNAALSADEAGIILKWIEQGAQDLLCDPFVNCDTMDISYANDVQGILIERKCISCHDDDTPGGDLSLHTHAFLELAANNGTLVGAISQQQGFSKMPPNAPKIPACEIAQITAWVNAGALNN